MDGNYHISLLSIVMAIVTHTAIIFHSDISSPVSTAMDFIEHKIRILFVLRFTLLEAFRHHSTKRAVSFLQNFHFIIVDMKNLSRTNSVIFVVFSIETKNNQFYSKSLTLKQEEHAIICSSGTRFLKYR